MGLTSAGFAAHTVASGKALGLRVQWQSNAPATLYLNYDTDQFTLEPHTLDLAADSAGSQTFPITFTRHSASGVCDVNFVCGASHDLNDSVAVT